MANGKSATMRKKRTVGFHQALGAGDKAIHIVGVEMRVVVIQREDHVWFAHGLDINYAAQGSSLAEVKKNFERGFVTTIDQHLEKFGHVKNLFRPTSQEAWDRLVSSRPEQFRYAHVSRHAFPKRIRNLIPFSAISFVEPQEAA